LLSISGFGWYYVPKGESLLSLKLMGLIDEQFLLTPYYGSRQMARHLSRRQGYRIGRHHVRRLMRLIGIEAIYLNAFESGLQARKEVEAWINHYNQTRPHSTFNGQTPNEVYNVSHIEGQAPQYEKQAA